MSKLSDTLQVHGYSRRDFLKFCGVVAGSIGLSASAAPKVAHAIEEATSVIGKSSGSLTPVIWLELASCTGCTESFAQVGTPDIATVVLDLISLNYAETLSAGAGHSLEEAKNQTIEAGNYFLIIEGALMQGWDGNALRIGWDGDPKKVDEAKGTEIVLRAAKGAAAIISAGSCAVDGGWQAADPNPGGAIGIQQFLEEAKAKGEIANIPPIINLPTCPANPEVLVGVIVDLLLVGQIPELNDKSEPTHYFNQTVHDNCPRRGHFENGEFVYKFGSAEEAKGFCLYAMGCKGPQTKALCPITRWNEGVSWCVEAGAPCAGCAVANPSTTTGNWVDQNAPFLGRFRSAKIGGIDIDLNWAPAGVAGVVAAALVAHGIGMKATGRTKGGADFEPIRKWDAAHSDVATGAQEAAQKAAAVNKTVKKSELTSVQGGKH